MPGAGRGVLRARHLPAACTGHHPWTRASVLSPPAEILSTFLASQGVLGVSTCPWATLGDLRHFSPNPWTVGLDQGVRSGCKGRSSLDVGDLVVASGWAVLEPLPSTHLLLLWVTQSLGLCLGFPGPGASGRDCLPPLVPLRGVTRFPLLPSGSAPRSLSQGLECSAPLRLLFPEAGLRETCGSADCSRSRVARTMVSKVAQEGQGQGTRDGRGC